MPQSAVFTLLPQDETADGQLRAALFVSPRLTPDGPNQTVSDFAPFANWPDVVAESRIVVENANGQRTVVAPDTTDLSSELWQDYIADLPVTGWTFNDLSDTEIRSFPAQSILAAAQGLYHAVAASSGGDHPDPLAGGLRNLGAAYLQITGERPLQEPTGREGWPAATRAAASAELRQGIDARVDRAIAERRERRGEAPGTLGHGGPAPASAALDPAAAIADSYNAALDLAEARRFYDRPEARDPDAATYPKPDPNYQPVAPHNDKPDFHGVLAALADHPQLLRRLGIIIGFELDPGFVGAGADLRAYLEHDLLADNAVVLQPFTRTVVDSPYFQPVSDTGDLHHGMLLLDDPNRYHLSQVDIDSTALLVEQRIANVYPIAQAAQDDDPVATDLPALRSTGFTLTRLKRALVLEQRIGRAADNARNIDLGNEVVLFAEDLVRGYRADVHDGADWRSLMHRHVSYVDASTDAERFAVDDEAYLKSATLTQTPAVADPPAYLHEALLGWDGWSLAVARPGSHIPRETPADGDPPVTDSPGDPFPGDLNLRPQASLVPGTLPRLRYGTAYRMRMRTVDLSGTSTAYPTDEHASGAQAFKRFQPIAHPVVVQRHAVTEGESTLRLVIRSGVSGAPADAGAALTPVAPSAYAGELNTAVARQFGTYRPACERHLAPPKVSQTDSELLGRFDTDAIGVAAAAADYRTAYARARREQGTLQDIRILSATDPDADSPADGIHLVPPLARDGEFTAAQLDMTLAALARGQAPDPGFAVVHDTDNLAVPYLPDVLAAGIALRFQGSGTASGWSHTEILPLGGDWPDIDTWRLVLVDGPNPTVTTADRVVTVALPPGGAARVRSSSTIDAATLELLGLWDWIADTVAPADRPNVLAGTHQMITPGETIILVHATQRPLARPAFKTLRPARAYGETHTGFRSILHNQSATTGRLDVEARWREWFDDPASGRAPHIVYGKTGHAFDLPVVAGSDAIDLTTAADARHEFGDTIHRVVNYTPRATTRFREYLPPPLASNPAALAVVGATEIIHVPCSARPGAPHVHSVMPTFLWDDLSQDRFAEPSTTRRRRSGLRVWLARPWYISGEDEMLGVIVSGEDGVLRSTDMRRQHISVWGKDPIRPTGELTAPLPRPRDFRGDGLLVRDRLTLAELGQTPPGRHPGVTVVGHPVTYSPERDMWFADIDVDPGEAAWPFLRLALTRFQPWSVEGAELSPVAIVDFVQILNARTASLTRPDENTIAVTVSGISDRLPAAAILPPNSFPQFQRRGDLRRGVRAWIERRGPLATDIDWTPVGAPTELRRIDEDEVARVWSATVALPEPIPPNLPGTDPDGGASAYRIVVGEWETLPYDEIFSDGAPVERYVYLDRFGL
ncbi:hypothetical protein [Mycobacterium sp. OAE908]|uniref:hypothetical protein n=1 Tax=Mycobacterium sp. OAE908 TaxID=2817899 RepID=UPI001AEAF196